MSRKCAACTHPDAADIDAILAEGGRSLRGLARTYALSEDSLSRHRKNHVPKAVAQAAEVKAGEKGRDLLDRIRTAEEKLSGYERLAYSLAHKGIRTGDDALVLRALSEARRASVESRLRLWDLELRVAETREIAQRLEEIEKALGGDAWVR
jgi:hypothetical protein